MVFNTVSICYKPKNINKIILLINKLRFSLGGYRIDSCSKIALKNRYNSENAHIFWLKNTRKS